MVWLGGPRRRPSSRARPAGIYLHDAPPGYHRPRDKEPLKQRRREARENYLLMRVATVVLALVVVAFVVMMIVMVATSH
jgi:hypothetical protein